MISFSEEFRAILETCIHNRLYFAGYRLPGSTHPVTCIQTTPDTPEIYDFQQLSASPGFVFAPFEPGNGLNGLIIRPDLVIRDQDTRFEPAELPIYCTNEPNQEYCSTSFEDYTSGADAILGAIRDGRIRKAVLSRLTVLEKEETFSPVRFYEKLLNAYPDAFVYLVNLPGSGIWTAASPELLLSVKAGKGKTMSVAGTQAGEDPGPWDQKEREEQEYVSVYIRDILDRMGLVYEQSPTQTIHAANLFHLCNEFSFDLPAGFSTGNLITELHPTPAVCGFPKVESLKMILEVEKHNREFYTGFAGPVNGKGDMDLFVNLRCMKSTTRQIVFFSGGGYTGMSEIQKEWEETNNKARTLLNVLKKI